MNILRIVIALCSLLVLSAWADPTPVGSVKTVSGDAFITTQGRQIRAALGVPVYLGSQLKTGTQSSLGIVFNDATVMSFGSDTELTVDDYLYQPTTDKQKLAGKLLKGSMNYLSGAIAKLHPEGVIFKSPTGTLGVRGTQFLVLVDGGRSYVTLIANPDGTVGKVLIQGARGEQLLDQANFGAPLDGSAAPSAVEQSLIQQDFGEALGARPVQPPLPNLSQLTGEALASDGAAAAGAQASAAAAVGGVTTPMLTFGIIAVGGILEASHGATGTTGTTGTR